jgi:hypothetical protein
MTKFEVVEVLDKVVPKDEEIAALRQQLEQANRRAQVAERQLNDVVMTASIKLATARMVLGQVQGATAELRAAIDGVLEALPAALPAPQQQQRKALR